MLKKPAAPKAPKQWDALNDNYMMGKSKMKGWDEEAAEAAENGDEGLEEEEEEEEEGE